MKSNSSNNEDKSNEKIVQPLVKSSSESAQSDSYDDIEIKEPQEKDDDDEEFEFNHTLHISPKLIYYYENSKPFYSKDEFIDSMSDIFMIESFSMDSLSSKQNNDHC